MSTMTPTDYLHQVGENAIDFVIRNLSDRTTRPETPEMLYYYRGQIDAITTNMLPGHAKGSQARALLLECEARLAGAKAARDRRVSNSTDYVTERRDRIEEEKSDAYIRFFDDAIIAQANEYMAEFGDEYRTRHPFKADSMAAHNVAIAKMENR